MQAMASNDMAVNFPAAHKFEDLYGTAGLLEALEHPEPNARAVAAHFLQSHPSPEVEAALIRRSTDAHEYVRMRCAFSLGKIGSSDARPVLQRLMDDSSEVVARNAAEALDELEARLGSGSGGAG